MRRQIYSLALCGLLASCTHRASLPGPVEPLADSGRARFPAQPALPALQPAAIPNITSFQLANGLQVYVVEQPGKQEVALHYALRNAAEDGRARAPGVATFVMALATGARHSEAPSEHAARSSGPALQGYVDRGGGHVMTTARSEDLERSFAELAALVLTPRIDNDSVRSVALAQLDEIDRSAYQTYQLAECHALRILYGEEHALGQPSVGRLADIAQLRLGELEQHHWRMFAPSGSALIVAGGIDTAQVRELAERHFAPLPGRDREPTRLSQAADQPAKHVRGLLSPGDVALVVQSFPAPAARAHDAVPFAALSLVAAELFSSRLYTALRGQEAFTYHVGARYEARAHDGWWLLEVAVDPADLRKALRIIDAQLKRVREQTVTDQELSRAVRQLSERRRAQLSDAQQAVALISELVLRVGDGSVLDVRAELERYEQELASLTAARLQEVADSYLRPEQRGMVVAGPLSRFEDSLRRLAEDVEFFVPRETARELGRGRE